MTIAWVDRVIFNAVSGGTADFVVSSAVTGYNTPALSSAVDGNSYHYAAQSADLSQWEVGTGVYTAATHTLARTSVELSSNSNALVSFIAPPQVMLTALAADFGASGAVGANPTATAGPAAVNGVATTFMRSDAAPAIQLGTAAQKGIVQVDGTTITAAAGIISSTGGAAGANPTATASDTAVNGVATTFMRSDAAPAVQKTSAAQFGLCKVDGTTISAAGGVISSMGSAASMVINSSAVTSGAAASNVLYEDGTLREASHLTISSGQPNVDNNFAYLYGSTPWIQGDLGQQNAYLGGAGNSANLAGGQQNTAIGVSALPVLINGNYNIALGFSSLAHLTSGTQNTAVGTYAGYSLVNGANNTVVGCFALLGATGDSGNVAIGYSSLTAQNGANFNTAVGYQSGMAITTGGSNCLFGASAGAALTTETFATFIGYQAGLHAVGTALGDFFLGYESGFSVTSSAGNNTAIGSNTMPFLAGGGQNVAIGSSAMGNAVPSGTNNLAIGVNSGNHLTTGSSNVLIGTSAGAALTVSTGVTIIGPSAGQSAVGMTAGDVLIGQQAGQSITSSNGQNLGVGTFSLSTMAGGQANVALGTSALASALSGSYNMAMGVSSLGACTSGSNNVAVGQNALASVTSSSFNVAIGQGAGINLTGASNICIGASAGQGISTGSTNCVIGGLSGINCGITTGSNNTVIGISVGLLSNPSASVIIATGDGAIREDFNYTTALAWTLAASAGVYTTNSNFMLRNNVGLIGGTTGNVPTLTAGPVTGNPTKWLPYDDNGTTRYIPSW